jgi:hypothetical protein
MEPTQKSAMPELPSISSMIKGKREDPRENLFEFKKRDPRIDQARMDATQDTDVRGEVQSDLDKNPIANREKFYPSDAVLSAPHWVGTGDDDNAVISENQGSRNVGEPWPQSTYYMMGSEAKDNANTMNSLSRGPELASYIVPGSPQYDLLKQDGYTDRDIEVFKNMLSSKAFEDWSAAGKAADAADDNAYRLNEAARNSVDSKSPLANRRYKTKDTLII